MKLTYCFLLLVFASCNSNPAPAIISSDSINSKPVSDTSIEKEQLLSHGYDTSDYNRRLKKISNGDTTGRWPVAAPYPKPGALLPWHRIIAYYGNLYSTRMGILGELPKDSMFKRLIQEVNRWQMADTSVKVLPALHYIVTTAQTGGEMKRLRMPFHQVDTIRKWAAEINALTFLDIQVGWSTLQKEIPELEKYLSMPDVHLGIDPEFSMKGGDLPGKKIGSFDAADINYAITYLANLVKKHDLPPKILVIHRFTQGMITNSAAIKKVPEVQVVIDMDGWGNKTLKKSTWLRYIYREPVHFTGFKIFYKNDLKKQSQGLYTPEELLEFVPQPMYIQYQ